MESLFDYIRTLSKNATEETRLALIKFGDELRYNLETPGETLRRMGRMCVPPSILQIAIDLKIFEILSKASEPVSDEEFAKQTGAELALIVRITRALASNRMIGEAGPGLYTSNRFSEVFAKPNFKATFTHWFKSETPAFIAAPAYLASKNYVNPTDVNDVPFHKAFNTDMQFFPWVMQDKTAGENAAITMSTWRDGLRTWLDKYPVQEVLKDTTENEVAFVDVGGGMGHQAQELKARYPDIKGRIIVQDLAPMLEHAPRVDGIEYMPQDFFKPQQVEGARIYYLRTILHDWPDNECVQILSELAKILEKSPKSKILLDEFAIPATNASSWATSMDFVMLSLVAARERTKADWEVLVEKAGLKIDREWEFEPQASVSIMEVTLK